MVKGIRAVILTNRVSEWHWVILAFWSPLVLPIWDVRGEDSLGPVVIYSQWTTQSCPITQSFFRHCSGNVCGLSRGLNASAVFWTCWRSPSNVLSQTSSSSAEEHSQSFTFAFSHKLPPSWSWKAAVAFQEVTPSVFGGIYGVRKPLKLCKQKNSSFSSWPKICLIFS